jgi:PadR family transcriptional regulator PadR
MVPMEHQELLVGLMRLHILHHAAERAIYGQWMLDELAEHGYRLSAGTLYPMLHGLERSGYLSSHEDPEASRRRKYYRITAKGLDGLTVAKAQLRELMLETTSPNAPGGKS